MPRPGRTGHLTSDSLRVAQRIEPDHQRVAAFEQPTPRPAPVWQVALESAPAVSSQPVSLVWKLMPRFHWQWRLARINAAGFFQCHVRRVGDHVLAGEGRKCAELERLIALQLVDQRREERLFVTQMGKVDFFWSGSTGTLSLWRGRLPGDIGYVGQPSVALRKEPLSRIKDCLASCFFVRCPLRARVGDRHPSRAPRRPRGKNRLKSVMSYR